jgi:predicted metalloprotease
VEEGLNGATQIDDDRMPMRAQGYVFRFNHSADQRVR